MGEIKKLLESILSYVPDDLTDYVTDVVATAPSEINSAISGVVSRLPADLDFMTMIQFLLFFGGAILLFSTICRVLIGRKSRLNQASSNAIGILFIYALTVMCYTFQEWNLGQFMSPLPFVTFSRDYLIVLPLQGTEFTTICREILAMVILAFLVNLSDSLLPGGKSMIGWFIGRFLTLILAILLHLVVRWAFDEYMPDVLAQYAPAILLGILAATMFLGLISLVLSMVLTVLNPLMGAVYTFFFSNIVGKQLGNAVFTTILLCIVVYVMGYYDFTVINISIESLTAYIPMATITLILWYGIGHVL